MKKKIALILASVMTLSMLPMNLFAASNNYFTKTPTTVPGGTLLYEEEFSGIDSGFAVLPVPEDEILDPDLMRTSGSSLYDTDLGDASYATEGTNLVLAPTSIIREGESFRIRLTNAQWFFRSTRTAAKNVVGVAATLNKIHGMDPSFTYVSTTAPEDIITSTHGYIKDLDDKGKFTEITDTDADDFILGMTYNIHDGVWIPKDNNRKSESGTYYRTRDNKSGIIQPAQSQIPYKLEVSSSDPTLAMVTILGTDPDVKETYLAGNPTDGYKDIVIPLVTLATGEEDVKVKVESTLSGVSQGTYVFGITGGGKTTTKVDEVTTARDEFTFDKIVIDENRISSLDGNGSIKLTLPNGYTWGGLADATVHTDLGLEWGNGTNDEGIRFEDEDVTLPGHTSDTNINYNNVMHYLQYGRLDAVGTRTKEFSKKVPAGFDYALGYDFVEDYSHTTTAGTINHTNSSNDHFTLDEQTIILSVNNFQPSNKVPGSIYIKGLKIYAEEEVAAVGSVTFDIANVTDDKWGVSPETVKVGERQEFAVNLKTTNDPTTLVAGRLEEYNSVNFNKNQKAASVQLYENVTNSWWAGRTTTLSLPDGVRFTQVDITNADNFEQGDSLTAGVTAYGGNGLYRPDGKKYGFVTVEDNKITFTNLKVKSDEDTNELLKGSIKMDLWLSIAANYAGENVQLTAGGTAVKNEVPSVIIAKVLNPVTVKAEVTDIKIGYQYQTTGNITITETQAGNLERGKNGKVSVTDMIANDVSFAPTTKLEVTEGDLKLKNISTTGSGSWSSGLVSESNAITFDVDRASTKASTITISNVAVRVDRTVPLTNNRPYDVIVWGSAVAQNFDTTSEARKDEFSVAGVSTNYIRVVTSADGQDGLLTKEVRVTKGERSVSVNGAVVSMPAAAYISPASNSMMVPIRFVAKGLGISEDKITYDDSTKTVTINHDSKVVQFTTGSSVMKINNAPINMFSKDITPLPVKAENTGDYVYIPFRALGEAFGIPVSYVNETSTAVYNAGAGVATAATTVQ